MRRSRSCRHRPSTMSSSNACGDPDRRSRRSSWTRTRSNAAAGTGGLSACSRRCERDRQPVEPGSTTSLFRGGAPSGHRRARRARRARRECEHEQVEPKWRPRGGQYRSSVEEKLGRCLDYADRPLSSLAGELSAERHHFNDKAFQLLKSVERLLRSGQHFERWLEERGQLIAPGNTSIEGEWARRVGHAGAHDEAPQLTTAQRVTEETAAFAGLVTRPSERLGWLAIRLDEAVLARAVEDDQGRHAFGRSPSQPV